MKQPIGNVIQNTVRGTRNLINNVRSGTRRLALSKPSSSTSTQHPGGQSSTFTWGQSSPVTTYFSPAKNVIPQKDLPNINFNESHIQSGNSTYPVVESNWVPMGVQKSWYSRLFKLRDLRKVQDDISKGNLFMDYDGASLRDGDRVLTEADFQNVRPATEVLGPKVFNTNAKGEGFFDMFNSHPHGMRTGEQFLGLLNADEAHIMAMGGDDIARRIMQKGKPRVLFRRYERTHPLRQQELNETAKAQQRTPRFNTLRVASNTTGNSTNIPFRSGEEYRLKITPESNVPVFSGAGNIGPNYNKRRHAIFMYNTDEYADDVLSNDLSGINDSPQIYTYSLENDAPLLTRTKLNGVNPTFKELGLTHTYLPITNDIGQTLDTGTLFHELMHSEMGDVVFDPKFSKSALDKFIKSNEYIPSQASFNRFNESGIVFPEEGYATERASELARANAMMKDIVVNSIRHRVETLAPKKIPGWFNKSDEERAAIIADVTLDLSENSKLANHIMRSWGFEGNDIRIPMSYIKINDPSYMYELLRAAEGIRKTRIRAGKYEPANSNMVAMVGNVIDQFPEELTLKHQKLLPKAKQELKDKFDDYLLLSEAAKQVARNQYNKLFAKTWVQTAPAIAATAVATPYLYSRLASDDQYIN